jgi:hypothetical protein
VARQYECNVFKCKRDITNNIKLNILIEQVITRQQETNDDTEMASPVTGEIFLIRLIRMMIIIVRKELKMEKPKELAESIIYKSSSKLNDGDVIHTLRRVREARIRTSSVNHSNIMTPSHQIKQ